MLPINPIPDLKNARLYNILKKIIQDKEPILTIGITGAGGAGKTTLATNLTKWFGEEVYSNIDLDDYLLSRTERGRLGLTGYHPQANDLNLAREQIEKLKNNYPITKPIYNHTTGEIIGEEEVNPHPIIIFEGVTTLYPQLNDLYDLAIFMDAKEETQIKSRIERDVNKRGYSLEEALTLFENLRPLYKQHIAPTVTHAHLVGVVDTSYVFSPTKVDWESLRGSL